MFQLPFDRNGRLILADIKQDEIGTLAPESRERLALALSEAAALEAKEAEFAAAVKAVTEGVEALDAAEKVFAKFPKMSFHELWKQSTSRPNK